MWHWLMPSLAETETSKRLLAKYADLLHPPDFEGGNQQEVYDYVQKAIHKSLKDGVFLRGGEDENVSFFSVL